MMLPPSGRNIGLDLVRATEAAALTAARWIGRGDAEAADQAATQAMFEALNSIGFRGRIAVGEEDKLGVHSPLDTFKTVGTGQGPEMDVVVDAIDGAKLLMHGRSGALAVAAAAPQGSIWMPKPAVYMEKLVVDREVVPALVSECLDAPVAWTLALISRLKKKAIPDLVVFMLERARHEELMEETRAAGARVWLRGDGDISGALLAATPHSGVDLMIGVGGVTEGLIASCGIKALGGGMLGRLAPQTPEERAAVEAAGLETKKILQCNEFVTSNEIFVAVTGITNGALLPGVKYSRGLVETHSMILRAETRTRRFIHSEHLIGRLQ